MKSMAVPDYSARQTEETYQNAARDVWRTAEANSSLRLTVISDSMRPLLRVGDVAVVHYVNPDVLQLGDVVVIQRDGEWITHRLVAVDEHGWHTHGDNTRYLDETASADQIVGRVIAIERGSRMIDLQQPRWRAIDRQINRVQRAQLRVLAVARQFGGNRSGNIKHNLAVAINWPFQIVVRWLTRF